MNLTTTAAEKLTPWYLLSCAVPFLPGLIVNSGIHEAWDLSVSALFLALSVIGITVFCLINLLAGPVLMFKLSGLRRCIVFVAFLLGAVFPIVVALQELLLGVA
jgi:hypothetical protein